MNILKLASLFLVVTALTSSCDRACKKADCQNEIWCHRGQCECLHGYEGDRCETVSREKMLGTYKGTYTCQGKTPVADYIVNVKPHPDPNAINKVAVTENGEEGEKLCTLAASNTFTLAYNPPGTFFQYVGSVSGDSLIITFKASNEGGLDHDCVFRGVRQ